MWLFAHLLNRFIRNGERRLIAADGSLHIFGGRPPGWARPHDGAQIHRARPGAAGVWRTSGTGEQDSAVLTLSARTACGVSQLTGRRLHRELRDLCYTSGYSILTDFLRDIRPIEPAPWQDCRTRSTPGPASL
jgi:hypothetical protein